MEITVNYAAVLVAAIASMFLGFIWYGVLFKNQWIALSGMTKQDMKRAKQRGMGKLYGINFVLTLVMSFVLAHFLQVMFVVDMAGALQLAGWIWLGFIAPVGAGSFLWEGKPFGFYVLNMAFHLVSIWVIAAILVSWV